MTAQLTQIPAIISQHVAEAAFLRSLRGSLLAGARVKLRDIMRLDERIAAHLDGVAVSFECGAQLAEEALASPDIGEIFVAAIGALARKDQREIDRLCALVEAAPDTLCGLTSAFGWAEPPALRGIVSMLLADPAPFRQRVAITACAQHRVDPGAALGAAILSGDAPLRARALRCAGELGRRDLLQVCVEHLQDPDPACAFWAAWSATLLGHRGSALAHLRTIAGVPSEMQRRALQLTCMTSNLPDAHVLLKDLVRNPANARAVIHGIGATGDPFFVPRLMTQMKSEELARLAGEAFSMITGADVTELRLQREAPEGPVTPNDDPDNEIVTTDPDEDLPWPDPELVQRWWAANSARFTSGMRFFVGAVVSREHCIAVLKTGYQRQRALAALHLSLIEPGTPLVNTSAPAWRQQRLLSQTS
jgi:uncharacterized protein (TIGR02270 family)